MSSPASKYQTATRQEARKFSEELKKAREGEDSKWFLSVPEPQFYHKPQPTSVLHQCNSAPPQDERIAVEIPLSPRTPSPAPTEGSNVEIQELYQQLDEAHNKLDFESDSPLPAEVQRIMSIDLKETIKMLEAYSNALH